MLKFVYLLSALALAACARTSHDTADSASVPVSVGPDVYMLAKSGGLFTTAGSSVKMELYREGNAFCASHGKELIPVSENSRDRGATLANAEIRFRCVKAADIGTHVSGSVQK